MERKAQGQIITTVLIILLILAAVVIVWQVIQRTTRGAAEQAEGQAQCFGLDLAVESVNCNGTDIAVVVKRGGDSVGGTNLIVTATGSAGDSKRGPAETINALETKTVTVNTNNGTSTTVTAAVEMDDGTLCIGETRTLDC